MNANKIDISTFKRDHGFYGEIELLLTIKSFDLQAIRARYVASKNNKSGKAGSVERRAISLGGIAKVQMKNGKMVQESVLKEMKEPRGISFNNGRLAIAAENVVYLIIDGSIKKIENPWFSYIHTIDFNPFDSNKIIIASSGLDCIFEYNIDTLECCYEWFAWENGFCESYDAKTDQMITITRNKSVAKANELNGKPTLLIENPKEQTLPTAQRAAFINTVTYDKANPNHFLATYFHEGAIFSINMLTGKASKVLSNLKTPHGGRNHKQDFMATSTGTGEIVFGPDNNSNRYLFNQLEGKPEELGEMEWVQNAINLDNIIIAIDSNRTSFVIFDIDRKLYDMIPYNNDWAVQDLVETIAINEQTIEVIKTL